MRAAPSVPFTLPRRSPRQLLRHVLGNLGDRSLIRGRVTGDAEKTYLHLLPRTGRRPPQSVRIEWQQTLVAGALRDLLCASRAPLLWSWTGLHGGEHPTWDATYPFLQRFPSPPEAVFRQRLAAAAKKWHFRVLDARYLHPLQGAPMVIVQTQDPLRLARAAGKVRAFLDPMQPNRRFELGAFAYEGFYFEAEDRRNRTVFAFANALRGTGMGSQWARSERFSPFPHG